MSDAPVIDVEETPTPEEAPTEAPQQQLTKEQELNLKVNTEIRFAEETILRALRSCIVNVTNVVNSQNQPAQ